VNQTLFDQLASGKISCSTTDTWHRILGGASVFRYLHFARTGGL
jgi:hypothetical protein